MTDERRRKETWALQKGLKESKATAGFCVCRLLGKRCRAFGASDCENAVPEADHPSLWLRNGKAEMFVSQPYQITDVANLGAFCRHRGLTCRIVTWPAWHNPGHVLHIEITKKTGASG
jgi:hypothetical protein